MKIFLKISIGIFIIIFLFLLFSTVIKIFNPVLYNSPGTSSSVEESKEIGVFINEYEYKFSNDSCKKKFIEIQEIWLEKIWAYGFFYHLPQTDNLERLDFYEGYQLIIRTEFTESHPHLYFNSNKELNEMFNAFITPDDYILYHDSFKSLPDNNFKIFIEFDDEKNSSNCELSLKKLED